MAVLPITIGIWALSVSVPVAIEAYQAADKIFVSPVARDSLVGTIPPTPVIPEGAIISSATWVPPADADDAPNTPAATATATNTATPSPTKPGVPSPTPTLTIPTATPYPKWDGDEPLHILLLGVDTRPSDEGAPRSDTIIVVRVDPVEKRVDMFSIPRDLLVAIPGFSSGEKVNAAYPWGELYDIEGGGPRLVMDTIELNFGIHIDHFATVDIAGMERIVDTIGGVIVDVKAPLKDDQYPTYDYGYTRAFFSTGLQRLNGVQAVHYARTRHSDGDYKRSERQQELLLAIRSQILTTGIISELPQLISDVGDALRTDLSPQQALSLARLAQDLPREQIYSHSLVPYMQAAIINEGWYLVGNWEALRWLAQNLVDDPDATNDPSLIPTETALPPGEE
jgi:LCP family protein required for cell wall assembly